MPKSNIPNQRQLRVGEEVRKIISNCLLKNIVPNIDVPVTVSFVRMSKDLKLAYIYIMPLGGENIDEIIENLNTNKFSFQKEVGKSLKTKFTPKIFFYLDDTFLEADKINKLLSNEKIKKDLI